MPDGYNGRELTIDWDSTTLAGVKTKGVNIQASPVDVTTDDSNGFRTLLPDAGVRALDYDVAGVTTDEVLIAEIFQADGSGDHETLAVNLPTGNGTISGSAMLTNLQLNGVHDGAVEFTASLQSSGAQTYTASV